MKGKPRASKLSNVEKEGGEEAVVSQLSREVGSGDLIWVRPHDSSWWPAQVVDENTVSTSNKPRHRSVGEVLVRLYGSYKYCYVDPIRCHLEFENILKENNGKYREIFNKALERDLHFKSGESKGKGSKSEGKLGIEACQDKKSKRNMINKSQEIESPTSTTGALGISPAVGIQGTKMLKAEPNAKIYVENTSKNKGKKKHGVEKKLFDNGTSYQARVSPRTLAANNEPTKVNNDNSQSEKTEEARSRKRKQGVQKKLKPNGPKSAATPPSKLLVASASQETVKHGYLVAEETEEVKSKKRKQDEVQKKVELNSPSSAMVSPRRLLSEDSKEAKSRKQQQDGMHKKLNTHQKSPVRVSRRRPSADSKPQTLVKDGNLPSEKAEGAKAKNQKQDGKQKKLKTDHRSPVRVSRRRPSTDTKPQTLVNDGDTLSEKAEGAKTKNQNQDGVQKKLKLNIPSSLIPYGSELQTRVDNDNSLSEKPQKKLRSKAPDHAMTQKYPKRSNPSPLAASPERLQGVKKGNLFPKEAFERKRGKTPKELAMQKKLKPDGPESSQAKTSVRKSEKLSGRRIKVMQTLGLIAPSGSPFHRS